MTYYLLIWHTVAYMFQCMIGSVLTSLDYLPLPLHYMQSTLGTRLCVD